METKKRLKIYEIIDHQALPCKDVPKEVKKLMSWPDINLVQEGYCPDLSQYRGYYLDRETGELIKKAGSLWAFYPERTFVREDVKDVIQGGENGN